uniref:uncharacterized protein LOC118148618 n=1 Tax=Callithrix jacchus TaxID=9483 RepID=UPI00159E73F4|nr:uncharacterized protein LOC118148618 [Callithrix jacchus]
MRRRYLAALPAPAHLGPFGRDAAAYKRKPLSAFQSVPGSFGTWQTWKPRGLSRALADSARWGWAWVRCGVGGHVGRPGAECAASGLFTGDFVPFPCTRKGRRAISLLTKEIPVFCPD